MKRKTKKLTTALLALGWLVALSPAFAAKQNGRAAMSARVREAANSRRPEKVDVIVTFREMPNASDRAQVKAHGGQVRRGFDHLPMLALRLPANALEALSRNPAVESITMDAAVESASTSAKQTARLPEPGSAGSVIPQLDTAVAVLDSGLSEHLDLNVQMRLDCTGTAVAGGDIRDEFNSVSYGGSDGSLAWAGSWVETNDDGAPGTGTVRSHAGQLQLRNSDGGSLESIRRHADFSGATSATLTFDFDGYGAGGLDIVAIEVSDDGGSNFTSLEALEVVGSVSGSRSYTLED